MGARVRDQREHRVTVRFTEAEHKRLLSQMKANDYLSVSKYIRVRCLEKRPKPSKEVTATGLDLSGQINTLSSEISRMIADYNATVKRHRSLLSRSSKDGSPAVDSKAVSSFLKTMHMRTIEVKALMEQIITLFENSSEQKD